ncbi:Vitamin B12 import ATP-binding protein BtuD [Methylobacterium crusticola]|uniref:Vitamin B12 import ATP-binding protein BtuD n=1 Tax=Methylobacterium crusticola TaxID=1697972 RepID=A0ABQ4QWL2_9HYPH|nr:ATP-binding cassette domain-containing protein [Methylobacterium crusticola]GJD49265.1 Vitamin B12 import ATP-binding protein BtuD [Methylobacterium crusticola]
MALRSDLAQAAIGLAAIAAATAGACAADGYTLFVAAIVLLTAVVGYGLNVLLGLAGLVSLGQVAFYAIGAYAAAIPVLAGWSFWLAWPFAGLVAAGAGILLAVPALRARGPYLAMVTIAFALIVEHGLVEWKALTGGANGLMGILPPTLGAVPLSEREMTWLSAALAALALVGFTALKHARLGRAMVALRDAEDAAQSIGIRVVPVRAVAFALSAGAAGLAGALFAPLLMFVSPGTFPLSQSILFLLAVVVGGAGTVLGPLLGAALVGVLPELLSGLAEYRLLFFGSLLLVVLRVAPNGLVGAVAALRPRRAGPALRPAPLDLAGFLGTGARPTLAVEGLGIAFGGVTAARDVGFTAAPGRVTSLIGPNGAGKTTILNIVCGFYRPDRGRVRLGALDLAGRPAAAVARAGIARTYQTTQLFASMSARDNVRLALPPGTAGPARVADALLAGVGYAGRPDAPAADLPHVDRRLVEIARALATRPHVLVLDEPAAGLMRAEKDALAQVVRTIAAAGIAVVLVEHDMALVMGVSDHVVVLDAGQVLAAGAPAAVARDPRVVAAYLGTGDGGAGRARAARPADAAPVLAAQGVTAGYGAAPVLEGVDVAVGAGECVALLGANGAGKSTLMRALSGLLRPIGGRVLLAGADVAREPAHRVAARGLALVPEGRQVFPALTARDNIRLGAWRRRGLGVDVEAELARAVARFPRLARRLDSPAGLLSGGEQQMMALARGLMADPRVLLLDEPSLGLAPGTASELFAILADLRDEGVTILVVDQMADLALGIADRGILLETGRVVRAGDAQALRGDGALVAAYLGHPSPPLQPHEAEPRVLRPHPA